MNKWKTWTILTLLLAWIGWQSTETLFIHTSSAEIKLSLVNIEERLEKLEESMKAVEHTRFTASDGLDLQRSVMKLQNIIQDHDGQPGHREMLIWRKDDKDHLDRIEEKLDLILLK